MDPKIIFWAATLVNLGVLCGFGLFGVRYARRGEIARHRRHMKIASLLIVAFLAAYLLKVVVLGREDSRPLADRERGRQVAQELVPEVHAQEDAPGPLHIKVLPPEPHGL